MNTQKENPPIIPIIVTVVLALGILIAFIVAGTRTLNEIESVLLAILLSAASIMASWLATHVYSQISLDKTIA